MRRSTRNSFARFRNSEIRSAFARPHLSLEERRPGESPGLSEMDESTIAGLQRPCLGDKQLIFPPNPLVQESGAATRRYSSGITQALLMVSHPGSAPWSSPPTMRSRPRLPAKNQSRSILMIALQPLALVGLVKSSLFASCPMAAAPCDRAAARNAA